MAVAGAGQAGDGERGDDRRPPGGALRQERRALPAGGEGLPQRGDARLPPSPPLPALRDPRPGLTQVGRGRERVHRLPHGPRGPLAGPQPPRGHGGAGGAGPEGHPLRLLPGAGGALGGAGAADRPQRGGGQVLQLRHRGHHDGHAPGAGLHRAGQDRQDPGRSSTAGTTTPWWPCSPPTTCPLSKGVPRCRGRHHPRGAGGRRPGHRAPDRRERRRGRGDPHRRRGGQRSTCRRCGTSPGATGSS